MARHDIGRQRLKAALIFGGTAYVSGWNVYLLGGLSLFLGCREQQQQKSAQRLYWSAVGLYRKDRPFLQEKEAILECILQSPLLSLNRHTSGIVHYIQYKYPWQTETSFRGKVIDLSSDRSHFFYGTLDSCTAPQFLVVVRGEDVVEVMERGIG